MVKVCTMFVFMCNNKLNLERMMISVKFVDNGQIWYGKSGTACGNAVKFENYSILKL